MALFDKLKTGLFGLKGQPGPTFENEGQRASSNIHALSKNNTLISSQDLISGRSTGKTKVKPSGLDLNGKTPESYTKKLTTTSTTTKLVSNLGLKGQTGPIFESESQLATSDIQALAKKNALQSSQDLLTGRKYGKGRFSVFVPASKLDGNGIPINGTYKDKGPKEGKY
jgi:hypothetical protein